MSKAEIERINRAFGDYARRGLYDSKWSPENPGNRLALAEQHERGAELLHLAFRFRQPARILEVGCGDGRELRWCGELFAEFRPQLVGVDLLANRLRDAQGTDANYVCANGAELCIDSECVDIVLAITVFSSILDDAMAAGAAREIDRVLRQGGVILWYDTRYRNPWNGHTRPYTIPRVRTLFPRYALSIRKITVLPPLMRRLGRATSAVNRVLHPIAPLRTHNLILLTKPASSPR